MMRSVIILLSMVILVTVAKRGEPTTHGDGGGPDPLPARPDGCQYSKAYNCYSDTEAIKNRGCTSWCQAVKDSFKEKYSYDSGCRYGNAQVSHNYCRGGRSAIPKNLCTSKCNAPSNKRCCGTCKQDCDIDVVYIAEAGK